MVELHCHLDGSLSEPVVREMAEGLGLELPEEEEKLQRALRAEESCENLAAYLERFSIPLRCLVTPENLRLAAEDLLRQAKEDGLAYIEARFAPLSLTGEGMSCFQAIEAVVEGMKRAEESYGVKGNVILCGMRHQRAAENLELVREGFDFFRQGVCGFDVAGDEASFSIYGQEEFLKAIKKVHMPFTLHAGECGSAESVRAALALGAARIGHGIAMQGHAELIRLCREKAIGIELCPTSNFQTGAARDWTTYPFKEFYEQGLRVTLNTDNRTVSNTCMRKEWQKLKERYALEEADRRQLIRNGIEASFAEDSVKQELLKKL